MKFPSRLILACFFIITFMSSCKKDVTECCNCPETAFLNALEICEDTPFDGGTNPNGYEFKWETLAPLLGVTSWEGVRDNLAQSGCDCSD